jgi:hypothetical protein
LQELQHQLEWHTHLLAAHNSTDSTEAPGEPSCEVLEASTTIGTGDSPAAGYWWQYPTAGWSVALWTMMMGWWTLGMLHM